MLRKLYKIYTWLVVAPILGISTAFFGASAVILLFFLKPRLVSTLCGKTWARVNSFVTPMRVKVIGRQNVDPRQSYVIVSNHQSQYDIFVLYGWLNIDFKWVMKQELRKVPAIGISCERLGHIYVDRSNREAALASINAAKQRIVDGTSVLFFPEGTRSRDNRMRPFKKGAFRMALDLQLPILPIAIQGTRDILPSDTLDLYPGRATMFIHPPIPIDDYSHDTLDDLMARTRAVIEAPNPTH
ncbi:MAG: 1-acyl-sn-glycerol-3-phosphate acyltransferase [Desulfobacteraceae bacterium]|nr:1-acyl-sn-glycerol-3-phosphate acyltransferase [Desulfobacteraceae bacterium]MBC2751796.1 1-acyl-sn-glycerol-3-phosphate acyltransferase [Desulfobacteraceae bacterium]